jgi:hypothetical protein
MGPPLYMQFVVDQYVTMQHIPVICCVITFWTQHSAVYPGNTTLWSVQVGQNAAHFIPTKLCQQWLITLKLSSNNSIIMQLT